MSCIVVYSLQLFFPLCGRPRVARRILDVRPEEDFLQGHLRGAYNVPWAEIASRGFEQLGDMGWGSTKLSGKGCFELTR